MVGREEGRWWWEAEEEIKGKGPHPQTDQLQAPSLLLASPSLFPPPPIPPLTLTSSPSRALVLSSRLLNIPMDVRAPKDEESSAGQPGEEP